jgi:DnaJ-class molecular chaperone
MDGAKASSSKDYYYILGVSPEATTAEIHEAFRELNDRFGPHVNISGQDPESMLKAFKDITEAYDILSDPARRAHYDSANLPYLQKTHLRQLWGKMTGTTTADGFANTAEDTVVEVEVTLREAIKGTLRKVRIDENLPCKHCLTMKPVERMKCQYCRGAGNRHQTRLEEVQLAPGIYDRMVVKVPNIGKFDSRVNRNGDLIINIKIRQHQYFTVMGRDITCTVPETFLEAILGAEIEVPTPSGKVMMKIQPLTQSGRVYRLKGMGIAGADLLATMEVIVPKQISGDEVELFRKLKTISTTPNPREELLKRLKEQNEANLGETQPIPPIS